MRKCSWFFLIIILCFLLPSFSVATKGTFQSNNDNNENNIWQEFYNGIRCEIQSLIQTKDGGLAWAGSILSSNDWNFWLVKLDENYNKLWSKTYGGGTKDKCYSVIQTSDGGFALTGYAGSSDPRKADALLVKTDEHGILEWSTIIGEEYLNYSNWYSEKAYSVEETYDRGFVIAGTTVYRTDHADAFLAKIDKNGTIEWTLNYRGPLGYSTPARFRSVIEINNIGELVLTGKTSDRVVLMKTDHLGVTKWTKFFKLSSPYWSTEAFTLLQTNNGFALAGTAGPGRGMFLIKTDEDGIAEWNQTYKNAWFESTYALIQTSDGGFALVGETWVQTEPENYESMFMVKTDEHGTAEWNQTYGTEQVYRKSGSSFGRSCIQTNDEGFVLAGYTYESFFLVKVDKKGIVEEKAPIYDIKTSNIELFSLFIGIIILVGWYKKKSRKPYR